MTNPTEDTRQHIPWNKGKLIGQKPPLKLNEIYAIRTRLQRKPPANNTLSPIITI